MNIFNEMEQEYVNEMQQQKHDSLIIDQNLKHIQNSSRYAQGAAQGLAAQRSRLQCLCGRKGELCRLLSTRPLLVSDSTIAWALLHHRLEGLGW